MVYNCSFHKGWIFKEKFPYKITEAKSISIKSNLWENEAYDGSIKVQSGFHQFCCYIKGLHRRGFTRKPKVNFVYSKWGLFIRFSVFFISKLGACHMILLFFILWTFKKTNSKIYSNNKINRIHILSNLYSNYLGRDSHWRWVYNFFNE